MIFRFKKDSRLLKKRDFLKVLSCKKKVEGSYLKIFYSNSAFPISKLGITASSRYGNAIARNKFKRIIREIYRTSKESFYSNSLGSENISIIVYPKKRSLNGNFKEIQAEFFSLISNIE